MAGASAHLPFDRRNYALGATTGAPDRTKGATFGQSAAVQQRERERLERERLDREGLEVMKMLSDEQKEEINEAVSRMRYAASTLSSSIY